MLYYCVIYVKLPVIFTIRNLTVQFSSVQFVPSPSMAGCDKACALIPTRQGIT